MRPIPMRFSAIECSMGSALARAAGFPPVARVDARVLILGSLPGQRSLDAQQYYAHPRNAFWKIMAELAGAEGSYEERCAALLHSRIALWDVLASSVRPGSLDANIRTPSAVVNAFGPFLAAHPGVVTILFNGSKAAQLYRQKVLPTIARPEIRLQTLPSTSPAHAALSFADKLAAWRAALT